VGLTRHAGHVDELRQWPSPPPRHCPRREPCMERPMWSRDTADPATAARGGAAPSSHAGRRDPAVTRDVPSSRARRDRRRPRRRGGGHWGGTNLDKNHPLHLFISPPRWFIPFCPSSLPLPNSPSSSHIDPIPLTYNFLVTLATQLNHLRAESTPRAPTSWSSRARGGSAWQPRWPQRRLAREGNA